MNAREEQYTLVKTIKRKIHRKIRVGIMPNAMLPVSSIRSLRPMYFLLGNMTIIPAGHHSVIEQNPMAGLVSLPQRHGVSKTQIT